MSQTNTQLNRKMVEDMEEAVFKLLGAILFSGC
jgi:heme oxygenase